MKPVQTLFEAGHHFGALGFSVLYDPLFGGEPQRKTILFLRDSEGTAIGHIFDSAEKVSEVLR
jgi:hypothetical protein